MEAEKYIEFFYFITYSDPNPNHITACKLLPLWCNFFVSQLWCNFFASQKLINIFGSKMKGAADANRGEAGAEIETE